MKHPPSSDMGSADSEADLNEEEAVLRKTYDERELDKVGKDDHQASTLLGTTQDPAEAIDDGEDSDDDEFDGTVDEEGSRGQSRGGGEGNEEEDVDGGGGKVSTASLCSTCCLSSWLTEHTTRI